MNLINGYKTYLAAAAVLSAAVANHFGLNIGVEPEFLQVAATAVLAATIRHAISTSTEEEPTEDDKYGAEVQAALATLKAAISNGTVAVAAAKKGA